MNRLTRQISLVLVSSSLVLYGCHRPKDDEKDDAKVAAKVGTKTASDPDQAQAPREKTEEF